MFTIKTDKFAAVDIIIMENTTQKMDKKNESITFDLKGSMYNRIVKFP